MNRDFIGIKALAGELKLSHKKANYGMTVSTEECVLQKPHVNYHFKLEDIVSVVPFEDARTPHVLFENKRSARRELAYADFDTPRYRFYVRGATVHNRSGMFRLGPTELIVPVIPELLRLISELGGFHTFD